MSFDHCLHFCPAVWYGIKPIKLTLMKRWCIQVARFTKFFIPSTMYTLFIIYVLWQLQLIQDHVFSLLSVDDDLYLEYKINKIADMFNLFSTILTAWLVQDTDLVEFLFYLGYITLTIDCLDAFYQNCLLITGPKFHFSTCLPTL